MKRILITGATGFVGKQVLKQLNNQSVLIRAVSRGDQGSLLSSSKNVDEVVNTKNFFTETLQWYENICKDVDVVIHVAWYAEKHTIY